MCSLYFYSFTVTPDVLLNHLELVMSSALFPVRCIWAPVTRSHLDFPLLTTPSSHPPNPQACQSFLLSQSAPTLLPNCWGRSRPFPHSCLYTVCDQDIEMYLFVCVCVSQLSGPDCPRGWQGRLPYVQCVLGPSFTGPSERRVKMAVYNTMKPVLLNNIFASIEGKIEPGTSCWVFVSRGSADECIKPSSVLLSVRSLYNCRGPEGFMGPRSREVWSRNGPPDGTSKNLQQHGGKR